MTYRFLSPAEHDLADAVAYYEEAVAGLGLDFLDEIDPAIRSGNSVAAGEPPTVS